MSQPTPAATVPAEEIEPCFCTPAACPFFCERHRMHKTEHWLNLCRNRADYRDKWDRDTAGLPPRGIGDLVAKAARATGIARVVKWVVGGKCGCKKRQISLNKLWPFGRKSDQHVQSPQLKVTPVACPNVDRRAMPAVKPDIEQPGV